MKHARQDYQRFQDPALHDPSLLAEGGTPFGEDEPVMLFRAQDKHFLRVLFFYEDLLAKDAASSPEIIQSVRDHVERAVEWRDIHGTKTPDL